MFGIDTAVRLLQAVSAGPATPMARCPHLDAAEIGKLLDAGAYGIICPAVDTAADAAALVRACRYPPAGERSFGPARGLLYGGPDYAAEADATVLVWPMIESRTAVANLDDILATPGIDGVYVGPNDLALSLGETPAQSTLAPHTSAALAHIAERAGAAGKFAGIFCAEIETAVAMAAQGYRLITPGSDVGILRSAAAQRIARLREGTAAAVDGGY
jgi:4-hydroxy-2-oxoheptanedioate aldolase